MADESGPSVGLHAQGDGNIQAGGSITIAETVNINPRRPPSRRRVWLWTLGLVLVVVGAGGSIGWIRWRNDPLEVRTEREGERLVLVAAFSPPEPGGVSGVAAEVDHALTEQASEASLKDLRVETLSTVLDPDDLDGARALAERYGASVIIWGRDTEFRVIASVLRLDALGTGTPEASFDRSKADFAQPVDYTSFVSNELAPVLAILSQFALSQVLAIEGDFTTARSYVDAVMEDVALVPASSRFGVFFNAAYIYGVLENVDLAIELYDRAISLESSDSLAFNNRGVLRARRGDYEGAIDDQTQAISLDSSSALSFNNRGTAFAGKGDYRRAIEDYDQSIALDPGRADAFFNRGSAYYELGEYERAIEDYDQSISLNPTDADSFYNRGSAFDELGEYERAIEDYDQSISLNPTDADAFNNRGIAHDSMNEPLEAIADYGQAITLDPSNAFAFFNRGGSYYAIQEYNLAIDDFSQAIVLESSDADAWYSRGLCYIAIGKVQEAIDDFDQSISLLESGEASDPVYDLDTVRKARNSAS